MFYDIGVINNDNVRNNFSFGSIRSDMGIGFTCDLEIVDSYYDFEKPLLFRLDFPFFLVILILKIKLNLDGFLN